MIENMDLVLPSRVASAKLHCSSSHIMDCNTTDFKFDLFTKYFNLKSSYSNVYHYHVKIKVSFQRKKCIGTSGERKFVNNEAKRKQVIAALLELKKSEKFKYFYDGRKNLLTSTELPVSGKSTFAIKLKTGEMYRVTVQPINKYYGTNAMSVSLLQNMIGHSGFSERSDLLQISKALEKTYHSEIRFDRYYSVLSVDKIDIGKGLEIWRGYERFIDLTQTGPAYVLNVTELVFHRPGPVIDYTNELLGIDVTKIKRRLTSDELKEIKNALVGVHVYTTHLPYRRRCTIEDLSNTPATDVLIDTPDKILSVAEYFEEKYCRLLYPNLPCFKMKSSYKYALYIPMENCVVFEGQQKLDYHKAYPEKELNLVSSFASFSKNGVSDTLNKIPLFMDLNHENMCRRENLPVLKYLEGYKFYYDSKWSIQRKLLRVSNTSWIVISLVDEIELPMSKITEFVDSLCAVCSTLGLWFGRFLGIRIIKRNEIVANVFQEEEIKNATFALILLSKKCYYHYDEVKFIADYNLGLLTKCVLDETVHMLNRLIAINICLSIDAKMGGISNDLRQEPKIFSQPTIVLGGVITRLNNNAISSVVGSLDAYPSRYQVSCRFQESIGGKIPENYITDIGNRIKTILNAFYHHTKGKYPKTVIFFRYSSIVSNFKTLKYYEVQAIQKSCKDVIGSIVPITFIVASRQHPKSLDSISKNIFHYILSDNLQGKTTYYYVIHDDNEFTADDLQQLTGHLSYVCKGNKFKYIPTPLRYAFRAAKQATNYAYHQCTKNEVDIADLPDFVIDAINKMEWKENFQF